MISSAIVLIVAIAIVAVIASTSAGRRRSPTDDLAAQLDRWIAAGLLTPDQAASIASHEHSPPAPLSRRAGPTRMAPATRRVLGGQAFLPPVPGTAATPANISNVGMPMEVTGRVPRRVPVVAEALGYIGGMLGTIGLVLLVARYWPDMAYPGRLALAASGAIVLAVAGWLVHEAADPASARLRWFLWLASTAAAALFAGVVAIDGFDLDDSRVALIISGSVAFQSAMLWWWRDRPVQQATALVSTVVAVGTLVGQFASHGVVGIAIWALGIVLVVVGLTHLTPNAFLTILAGVTSAIVGAGIASDVWTGPALLVLIATAGSFVAVSAGPGVRTRAEQLLMTIGGSIALVQTLPMTVAHFAEQAGIATGLTMWVIGLALWAAGARRHTGAGVVVEGIGGLAVLVGAAVTGVQSEAFATLFGVATAIGLVALGMVPGRVLMSVLGSAGLLAFVPWSVAYFFPGEGRAPLLIMVSGALIVAIAVMLTRQGKRFRRELTTSGAPTNETDSETRCVDVDAEEHPTEGFVETR